MKMKEKGSFTVMRRLIIVNVLLLLCGFCSTIIAQPDPPRPVIITVNSSQPLAFGAFTPGASGGTVTVIAAGGTRSSTGTVILLGMGIIYTPTMFYIKANPGTVISLLSGSPTIINGSNGGSLSLQVNDSFPASPFVTTVSYLEQTTVLIGGTLTVGSIASNPPGYYSGTIDVTFVQE